MASDNGNLTFDRPFPALTTAQRLHLELYGYVVIENVLSPDECSAIRQASYRVRDELLALDDRTKPGPHVGGAFFRTEWPHLYHMAHIIEADPTFTAYATHPRLVAAAEELIGGEARIVETITMINRRVPDSPEGANPDQAEPFRYRFHRGVDINFSCHSYGNLFHCNFVKTLTNLTDLGPDDGGTVVIAGSHKLDGPDAPIVEAAYQDPSMIHQVVAPAGSTLLFSEALIHATGQNRSDRDRVIIVTGYACTLYPYWAVDRSSPSRVLSDAFSASIPPHMHTLFHGRASHVRGARYRRLADPVDDRTFALGKWDDRRPVERTTDEGLI